MFRFINRKSKKNFLRWITKSSRQQSSVRRRAARLQLEQLEDRAMPALVAAGAAIEISGTSGIARTNQAVSQADNNGNFAVAWCDNLYGTVYTQVYSAGGTALTGRITVGASN